MPVLAMRCWSLLTGFMLCAYQMFPWENVNLGALHDRPHVPGYRSLQSIKNGSGLALKKPRSKMASGAGKLNRWRLAYRLFRFVGMLFAS